MRTLLCGGIPRIASNSSSRSRLWNAPSAGDDDEPDAREGGYGETSMKVGRDHMARATAALRLESGWRLHSNSSQTSTDLETRASPLLLFSAAHRVG